MNSTTAMSDYDMGQDGVEDSYNMYVARDMFGYTLGYYQGDYYPAGGSAAKAFEAVYRGTNLGSSTPNLYNGNIRYMATGLAPFDDRVFGRAFGYDQLNRIMRSKSYFLSSGNTWSGINETNVYKERFSYDGNGNIMALDRYGDMGIMDSLSYHYSSGTNRLLQVNDDVTGSAYDNDIDNQTSSSNYTYDDRGNMVADALESQTIYWNNMGKVIRVQKSSSTLYFGYDAMSNRLSKQVGDSTEYYLRDAQGNVMAIYRERNDTIMLISQHIYGSSRLGQRHLRQALDTGTSWSAIPDTGYIALQSGLKEYELTNHLGNVLATITDRRLQRYDDTTEVAYYKADILSAQDYYPFGMIMTDRQWSQYVGDRYRFGFNGKESDNEWNGDGAMYDYGFRIYDPRIAKFLSTDPLSGSFPMLTPYQYATNNPVWLIDLDGQEGVIPDPQPEGVTLKVVGISSVDAQGFYTLTIEVSANLAHGTTKSISYSVVRNVFTSIGNWGYVASFSLRHPIIAYDVSELAGIIDPAAGYRTGLNEVKDYAKPEYPNLPIDRENCVVGVFSKSVQAKLAENKDPGFKTTINTYGKMFRHQLYAGLLYSIYGEDMAKSIGDHNEMGRTGGNSEGLGANVFKNKGLFGAADLINNSFGIDRMRSFIQENGEINSLESFTEYLNYVACGITEYKGFPDINGSSKPFNTNSPGVKTLYKSFQSLKKKNAN